jgi:hypothetical protein
MRRRAVLTIYLALSVWLLTVPAAHAYIDPGSTSMIFQVLIAGLAAAGTAITVFWNRLTGLFRRNREPASSDKADVTDVT